MHVPLTQCYPITRLNLAHNVNEWSAKSRYKRFQYLILNIVRILNVPGKQMSCIQILTVLGNSLLFKNLKYCDTNSEETTLEETLEETSPTF